MSTFLTLLTGGGLLAVGSTLTGWQTNRFSRKRDQAAHAHELTMAQEARRQDRLDRAYTDLGIYLSRHADWARSVRPIWGPVPPPERLTAEERWRIENAVKVYGSKEGRHLLAQREERFSKIQHADFTIRQADEAAGREHELEQMAQRERRALDGYKQAMYEAADRIRDQMSAELNGQPALPAAS